MRANLHALPLLAGLAGITCPAVAQTPTSEQTTATPIKHLIVVVGENLTFDNLFGTYRPRSGQSVANLLSKGIVNGDGTPGPNFALAAQRVAKVHGHYEVTPEIVGAYESLPQPNTTYAVARPRGVRDQRFPATLPNGPFQITRYLGYADHIGDPVHRFFQMWQPIDGGKHDLFVWVDETSGEGARNHNDPGSSTNQGALAMGFYNVAAGDAPYVKALADEFALADNYHQAVMGGTAAYVPENRPAIGDLMNLFEF